MVLSENERKGVELTPLIEEDVDGAGPDEEDDADDADLVDANDGLAGGDAVEKRLTVVLD